MQQGEVIPQDARNTLHETGLALSQGGQLDARHWCDAPWNADQFRSHPRMDP
jgi:hypothetical protein